MADGTATPQPDFAAAREFLEAIAPGRANNFRLIDEKRKSARNFDNVAAGAIPSELAKINAQGFGVFFTVNALDGKGRTAQNVTAVHALWIDYDTADTKRPDQFAELFALEPSAIVESSPGKHHVYWFAIGLPLEQFTDAQLKLAAHYGTDPTVSDLPRVMRLPGFMHRKGEPFLVRRIGGNARRYDAAEIGAMLAAIPKPETPPAAPLAGPPSHAPTGGDRYAMRALETALGAVLTAREGERNATLNREAFGLFGLVKAGRLDAATVRNAFEGLAASNGLEPGEIAATLASAESAATPRYDGLPVAPQPADLWRLRDGSAAAGAPLAPSNCSAWASVISLENLANAEPQFFWTAELLPAGTTTLLSAHGGTGKTTLALQWAVCLATGRAFFGKATTAGRVLFYSAEDNAGQIRARLRVICEAFGIDAAALSGRLLLLDATDIDPSLYAEAHNPLTHGRDYRTTLRYDRLREEADGFGADVLIIDNASDTYDAEENARARVRAFMRALNVIAKERDAAVLLLAHVDKNTAKNSRDNSEGYSGSTAWHNSARSRLFLSATEAGLLLEHQKCNLGPKAQPIPLQWSDGVIAAGEETGDNPAADLLRQADEKAVLRLISEFTQRGESVATSPQSRGNAHALLKGQPTFPQSMKRGSALFDLLRDSERAGHIERETYRTPDRKDRERWQVTASGRAWAGIAPPAPTAPTPVDDAENPDAQVKHPGAPTAQGV